MQKLKEKTKIKHSEEHFHDEWALSVDVNHLDAKAPFEGITSPEYKACIEFLGDVKNKKILNIGCGLGEETVYLALKGGNVTAIDLSKEMTVRAHKLAKRYKVENKIKFLQMDGESLKFKKDTFDAVLGCAVLHHGDIKKMVSEGNRVLKKGGIAVYLEPLHYNPVINVYRKLANSVRTDDEHPLNMEDINLISNHFSKFEHREFQLFTLLIFVWFFIGEKLHPNKARYWKKIVWDGKRYEKVFKLLQSIDNVVLKFSPLRKYCWVTVLKGVK